MKTSKKDYAGNCESCRYFDRVHEDDDWGDCRKNKAWFSKNDWCGAYKKRAESNPFLFALCELIMVSDPWPASENSEAEVKRGADKLAKDAGFIDWVDAYHHRTGEVQ